MTAHAIEALEAERQAVLRVGAKLSPADWAAPSGCPGWSVQDVVSHLGALYWMVADPSALPDVTGLPTEQAQEFHVEARRSLTAAEVLADYESISAKAIEVLASFDGQDAPVPLGDLGTYPLSVLPTAFCFDHYTHLRADLFAPRGPLTGTPPPSDELRLAPALDWISAALPQQNQALLGALENAAEIVLTGPGARTVRLGHGPVTARVSCDTPSFVRWVTQRASWAGLGVQATGDEQQLALIRSLHVF